MSAIPSRRGVVSVVVLWGAGMALFLVGWAVGNPPGYAPDEEAHRIKALGVASGQLVGTSLPDPGPASSRNQRFRAQTSGRFRIPARLATDPRWTCNVLSDKSAACLDQPVERLRPPTDRISAESYVSPYPPLPYLPIGLAARAAPSPGASLYWGRLVVALVTLAALLLAMARAVSAWMRVAVFVCATPMLVFLGGSINTSAIEIAAAAALVAVAVRGLQSGWSRFDVVSVAVVGTVLALVRPFGVLWIAAAFALLLAFGGRGLVRTLRARWDVAAAFGLVALGAGVSAVWNVVEMPHSAVGPGVASHYVVDSMRVLPRVLTQSVGEFGWTDIHLPGWLSGMWVVLYVIVVGRALRTGSRRQRVGLVVALVGLVAFTVAVSAATQIPFGFALQARYVMPLLAGVLLVAGSFGTREGGDGGSWPAAIVAVVAALLQGGAWYINARRVAVGASGPIWFVGRPEWSPPPGWPALLIVVGAATLCLAAAGWMGGRQHYVPRHLATQPEPAPMGTAVTVSVQ